jgi:hypothetical protein
MNDHQANQPSLLLRCTAIAIAAMTFLLLVLSVV